jgi:hypothetical protein
MQFSPPSLHFILSALFTNIINLCSSLHVRDQVSHPFRTTGKIIILYILIFTSLTTDWESEGFELNGNKHYQNSIYS